MFASHQVGVLLMVRHSNVSSRRVSGVSSVAVGRHRVAPGRVRVSDLGVGSASVSSTAGYVGRVGVLAVALGVGAAVVSMPLAVADSSGSSGSAGSVESTGSVSGRGSASSGSASGV